MNKPVYLLFILFILLSGCSEKEQNVIIFHAGSLSLPVKKFNEAFEKSNPGVKVLSEAAGSLASARKITELAKTCDIVLSADYFVIDNLLIPGYSSWNIKFATNEIVIAYLPESKFSGIIRDDNWPDILLRKDVIFGRADPDADPCGYRTVFATQLAGEYYGRKNLSDSLLSKDRNYIRPKEVDLVALCQTGVIDYMFQYKSVSIQHGLKYLELPDEINLSDNTLKDYYSQASYMVPGNEPGSRVEVKGDYICYSGTVLDKAPNHDLAIKYFTMLISQEGQRIFKECGQEPLVPALTDQPSTLPQALKQIINDTLPTPINK